MAKFRTKVRNFISPPPGSPRWMVLLPYALLVVMVGVLLVGGAYGWEYTNSPAFCGTTCHTMPPEYAAYEVSPHARIYCTECHIGREFVGNQIFRKAGDMRHVIATVFETYEYPIRVKNMRPAPQTCEKCHSPEKFSDDSLRVITRYQNHQTASNIYLILKTGGGSKREGLGRGIHWHIENPVYYYPQDDEEQIIPYVKVVQDDGSTTEYVDIGTDFDPETLDETKLKQMDCITCHNRITHRIYTPEESIDNALKIGKISTDVPGIRQKGIEVLRGEYKTQQEALDAIAKLDKYYRDVFPQYYSTHGENISQAISELQHIYTDSVFLDQKVDWDTHPNNVGHIDSPGCFRCHDGKHLDANQQAIRLECNLCHSIPVVSSPEDFVTNIEISRGLEPETHLNANWISMHNQAVDVTCSNCHTTEDMGGTSNTSFCSNSACHGTVFTYAGFDAPALHEIIQAQLPPPVVEQPLTPPTGAPTYDNYIGALFRSTCTACHGEDPSAGLVLLTYEDALKGSENGPVIIPGDSANSKLVQIQSARHFKNFSPEDLALIIQWIDAGAPEK